MAEEYERYKVPQRWFSNDYLEMLLSLVPEGFIWIFDRFFTGAIVQDTHTASTVWQDTSSSASEKQDVAYETGARGNLLKRIWSCFAEELALVEQVAFELLNQTDPGVANELLDRHEKQLGLPEKCFANLSTTLAERQRQAHAKLFKRNETTTKQYYIDLAEALGFEITVVEVPTSTAPRRMGVARMGVERMGGIAGNSILQITIVSGDSDHYLLKCVIENVAPAHAVIQWVE